MGTRAWCCLLALVVLPGTAHGDEKLRVFLQFKGSAKEQQTLQALESSFQEPVLDAKAASFAGTVTQDKVIAECNAKTGVSASAERECQLKAARRESVPQLLELSAKDLGDGTWSVVLDVWDTDDNSKICVKTVIAVGKKLSAAAASALPQLGALYVSDCLGLAGSAVTTTNANTNTATSTTTTSNSTSNTTVSNASLVKSTGRLEIMKVKPSPVTVLVNGSEVGTAPNQFLDLPLGTVEVTLRALGYRDLTKSVTLTADQLESLTGLTLEALPGVLEVWCNIEGASIEVSGEARGTTRGGDTTSLELAAGKYDVRVTREGYTRASESIELTPGGRAKVTATLEVGSTVETPAGYVLIAAGTFAMGSPSSEDGRFENERSHEVTLTRDFYLKSTEVTQGEWLALMGTNPSYFTNCGDDCPVEQVSWWDAVAYCNAASRSEGLTECYTLSGCSGSPGDGSYTCSSVSFVGLDCEGYRLPTEAEWEYAARAGTTGKYADGSSSPDNVAWYAPNSRVSYSGCADASTWGEGGSTCDGTHGVGAKSANAWGLYDMHGNVWEWTWDWDGDYPTSKVTDPLGASSGSNRGFRGGSWDSAAAFERSALRFSNDPGLRNFVLGFRPARSV